ncbi:MAG: T9SS type A sorting domain-containing protein [Bacteroidetes bacterium]|nr:T9SS type A sorting domain-containing protein [Bacteroidota bacterium]
MKLQFTKFSKLLAICLLANCWALNAQKIVLVGGGSTISELPSAEQKAYNWALSNFGSNAVYQSFASVAATGLPATARVVWFHFEDDPALPASAAAAAPKIGNFVKNGGGLLASAFATSFILDAGITTVAPTETINNDPAGPDVAWGVKPLAGKEGHPIFAGLTPTTDWVDPNWGGFRTISTTTKGREAIRWWTGGTYPGTPIACMPWWNKSDPNIPIVGEITSGNGRAMTCTAPGFNWVNADINGATEQATLQLFTANMLNYLQTKTEILLVGEPANLAGLPASEQNAYNWALNHYGLAAQYRSFNDIASNGIENSVKTIWFHLEDAPTMPASAAAAVPAVRNFVKSGGGLFTSSFATQFIFDIGATTVAPTETINNDPAGPDAAWGVKALAGQENHPFFQGMTLTTDWADPNWGGYRTIGATNAGHEAIRWWTGGKFPGTPVGCMPWWNASDKNIPILGTLKYELGTIVIASAPGYQWLPATSNAAGPQANLEKLTENILKFTRPGANLIVLGEAASVNDLPVGEKNAYQWALSNYAGAQYRTFADVAANGIPAETEVLWFHFEDDPALPASAASAATKIDAFIHSGGGILLSGFATGYATAINATTVAPTETINNDPAGPDVAWGVRPLAGLEGHPVFKNLTPTTDWVDPNWGGFRTIGTTVKGREAIRWWTGGAYPGKPLACMPWWNPNDSNIPVIGLIKTGDGGVVTSTAPGYNWVNAPINDPIPQGNLQQLTANMLEILRSINEVQSLNVALAVGGTTIKEGEEAGKVINVQIANATFKPVLTPANWQILNMPPGISATVAKVDNKNATITLSGTAADYDVDITNFTIRIPASEFLDLSIPFVESIGAVIFDAFIESAPVKGKVALVGTEANLADLDPDEKEAYSWAIATLDTNAVYFNIVDLVLDPTLLKNFKAIWWHYDKFIDLPLLFDNPNTEKVMKDFRNGGGGILLTGAATQYVKNLGVTTKGPNQVSKAASPATNPDHWGFRAKDPNHPIFTNLPVPFTTLYSTTGLREDLLAWWNLVPDFDPNTPPADRFDGTYLATTEWDANFQFICSVAEFKGTASPCTGNVLTVGAGAYDWYLDGGTNEDAPALKLFTTNMLNYLRNSCTTDAAEPVKAALPVVVYPNPASELVNIAFSLENSATVTVEIINLEGKRVASLMNQVNLSEGTQMIQWHSENQPQGLYFYRILAGNKTATGKIVLNK